MKLAFIYGDRLSSKLTFFFTRSRCFHVAFTDTYYQWDMHLLVRRRLWPQYPEKNVILVDCPVEVSVADLEYELSTAEYTYSFLDYALFALRPLYHLFGKSTRNMNGKICSEFVADVLKSKGWKHEFKEVPSPADMEEVLLGKRNAICQIPPYSVK